MGKHSFLKSSLIIAAAATTTLAFVPKVNAATAPSAMMEAHVQQKAWVPSYTTSDSLKGAVFAGTTGESLRLEAVKIRILNKPTSAKISYRAHVQTYGWQDWVEEGAQAGTTGESKRMEGLELAVEGAEGYVVKYRAHVQTYGWQDWVTAAKSKSDAEPTVFAGTEGESKRLEAIEVVFLTEAQNDLIVQKENAIAQLKATYSPTNHTIMKEEYDKAMEVAVKAINDATDAQGVQSALATQLGGSGAYKTANIKDDDTIKKEVADEKETKKGEIDSLLDQIKTEAIKGIKPSTKFVDYEAIKSAVEDAKAAIDSVDTYKKEDVDKAADDQKVAIYNVVKDSVKELVDQLYQQGLAATKETDQVVTKTTYDFTLEKLEKAEPAADVPTAAELKKLTDIQTTMTQVARSYAKTLLKTEITAFKSDSNGLGIKTESTDVGDKFGLITGAIGTATYGDITKVKEAFANMDDELTNKDFTYGEAVANSEAIKSNAFAALKGYMADIIGRITDTPGTDAKKVLSSSNLAKATKYNKYKDSTDVEDIKNLIDGYKDVVAMFEADS